jgi:conjugal transfer pilus assembly protein TraB
MAPEQQEDKGAYMPAGSLIGGILMTGVDAPTDKSAEAEPHPVLIRVKREAILPSRFRLDIRECFIIGEAHAKLNTSRAYIRANRISCIRSDGGVIEAKMKAYAVDTDSKIGLTGQIVSRQGTVIARSIMAGFLSGLSQAFTPTQVPVIIDSTDGNQVFQSASAGDVGAVAGYNGLATAAEKVSDYYLKIAEDLYPVVELNAGRKIDLILLQGMALDVRG